MKTGQFSPRSVPNSQLLVSQIATIPGDSLLLRFKLPLLCLTLDCYLEYMEPWLPEKKTHLSYMDFSELKLQKIIFFFF